MKPIFALLFVLSLTIYIHAQPSNTNSSDKSNENAAASKNSNTNTPPDLSKINKVNGKVVLPPEKANPLHITKFSVSPVIDGKVNDEVWKTAAVLKDFYQTYPGDNTVPSKPTEVLIGYDERFFYVAFRCFDDKDKIRGTVANRDNIFGEDNVRMWLDTYNDQRRAYIIGFNPLGVQQDGIYTEGQNADFSVDIVMESKAVIEEWGWSVEAKIPFKSLRYVAGKGKMWGFNVARNIDRFNDEFDQWMPDDRNVSGFLIKFGKITGLDDVKTERTLEVVPSVTISEAGRRVRTIPRYLLAANSIDPGRFINPPIKQDIGVSVKYTITPNVTLDATYNPDFAEIEADAPVVLANQRFPIFFQEKRPFFLEGVEIFQSPIQIFYSRTIVDPDIAAKLTGKIGKTSFGILAASDKAPGNYDEDDRNDPSVRPRINEFLDKNALFGVVRVKRDFGKENNLGFFGTYRSFPEQHNIVAGFDGSFKVDPKTVLNFQVVGSNSKRCLFDAEFDPAINPTQAARNQAICGGSTYNRYRTGNGLSYFGIWDHTAKNNGYSISASGRTKDYRADAGFTRRTNTNSIQFGNRLSTESRPKSKIIRIDWRQFASTNFDWKGRIQDLNLGTNVNFAFQHNTFASFDTGVYNERLFEEEFGLKRSLTRLGAFAGDPTRSVVQHYMSGNIDTTPVKRVSMSLFLGRITNSYDFDFGGGERYPRISPSALTGDGRQDPGPGKQFDVQAYIEVKPTDPFRVSLQYTKSRLVRNDTNKVAFDSNIFSLRSTYQFSRFTFIRARVDYDTLSSNISEQFLVGWNPNPGTAFYVGYNDNTNYNGFNPYTGQLEPKFERNGRTFFIRASYLFRRSF